MSSIKADIRFKVVHMYAIISKNIHFVNREFANTGMHPFLSISMATYISNYLKIKEKMKVTPKIFGVNYFQRRKDGSWLTGVKDKRVWLKWMELRTNNDIEAIETPVGYIPKYEDLKQLFTDVLNKEYTVDMYKEQFMIRVPENIAKMDRIIKIYKEVKNTPPEVFKELEAQKKTP